MNVDFCLPTPQRLPNFLKTNDTSNKNNKSLDLFKGNNLIKNNKYKTVLSIILLLSTCENTCMILRFEFMPILCVEYSMSFACIEVFFYF